MARDEGVRDTHRKGLGYWLVMVLGVVLLGFGLALFIGGIWLIALGGSWYYALAGAGVIATACLLFVRSMLALWVYLITYAGTVIWALWEAGLNGWAQVPRLVAPTLVLVFVLLSIPVLRRHYVSRRSYSHRGARAGAAALFLMLAGAAGYSALTPWPLAAQNVPPAAQEGETAPAPDDAETAPAPEGPELAPAPADTAPPDGTGVPGEAAGEEVPDATPDSAPGGQEPQEPGLGTQPAEAAEPAQRQTMPLLEVGEDWPAYGGNIHALRYSPLNQINRDNVSQLERAWEYRTGDLPPEDGSEGNKYSPEITPLKIGDDLYLCSAMGIAISVDAATGKEEWRYDPEVPHDAIPYGATCRGVAFYENPDADPTDLCAARIIWGTLDARLLAVDARLGQPCPDFGQNGEVDLETGIGDTVPGWYSVTSPPTIVRGIAVVGAQVKDGQAEDSPSGVVRGYDAITGELAWAWDLGNPSNRGAPAPGDVYTRGTPNMWTIAAGDNELGHVYLPLGNSAVDYYGSNRSEAENEYATSLVAVDVETGEDVWHFQTVYRDVWDYDLGSQPSLVDFPGPNGPVPALILSSKQGEIYILDRRTGEPLFPVEEREVPQGGVEPDYLSPVQPFSTYHSLLKPDLEPKDMWGMTPLDQLYCRIRFHQAHYQGVYQPPTADERWIQYPGYNGGQDWGSMAVDTERGILIANYNDMPNFNRLIPREEVGETVQPIFAPGGQQGEEGPQLGSPYAISVNAGWRVPFTGLLCKQPPYGGIRAIDLATGETLWDHPLGQARRNGPFGIPSMLPITIGTPNNGGPVATAGGLVFIAATTDNVFRAMDIETGEVLWSDTLPAGGQTTPITYEINGRQFVALAPGGHHFMETPVGDYLITWALPEGE